jgi:hypothetical protein
MVESPSAAASAPMLRGLKPLTPSLRTRGMGVVQARLSTDLGVRRRGSPVEVNGVAVLTCCTSRPANSAAQLDRSQREKPLSDREAGFGTCDRRVMSKANPVSYGLIRLLRHHSSRSPRPQRLIRHCRCRSVPLRLGHGSGHGSPPMTLALSQRTCSTQPQPNLMRTFNTSARTACV